MRSRVMPLATQSRRRPRNEQPRRKAGTMISTPLIILMQFNLLILVEMRPCILIVLVLMLIMMMEIGKVFAINYETRPSLRMLAASPTSDMDLTGNAYKAFDDHRDFLKDLESPTSIPTNRWQAFRDGLKQG